jgi:DNA polymerase III epsilon subunit-like protein|tara:strand:+ start:374 stop:1027 length:654 start_codon:yes stop_codon:yes gene_type:complete
MKPIVLDIETSGLDKINCGIWQIGAIDLNDKEEFLEEARIDDEDCVEEGALRVIGKTEEELRDSSKQSQKELLENFFKWVETKTMRNMLCQNPQFDISFLEIKANKYGLKKTFQFRAFDLHTLAQTVYFSSNKEFHVRKNEKTLQIESDMNLSNILKFCNIPDNRINLISGKIVSEGKPHNALEDCKLEGECFSRLIYGKNLFQEYSQFEIPEVLQK